VETIAIDAETRLLRPGQMAPGLVCLTEARRGALPTICDKVPAIAKLRGIFSGHDIVVGHNTAYDLAVACATAPDLTPLVFRAYDENRVTCTMLRQQLLDIAAGRFGGYETTDGRWVKPRYSLDEVSWVTAGIRLKKTGFRLFYTLFDGVPIEQWDAHAAVVQARAAEYRDGAPDAAFDDLKSCIDPKKWPAELDGLINADPKEARLYALEDARATLAVHDVQEQHKRYLDDQHRQAFTYFVLHLSSVWGLRTNGEAVDALRVQLEQHYRELEGQLVEAGLVRQKGSRDMRAVKDRMIEVCKRDGLPIRRTDGHAGEGAKCKDAEGNALPSGDDACVEHVSTDGDACNATEDPLLVAFAELSTTKKVLTNDIEALKKGVTLPVHPSYGFAETGRTTCRNPNIQQTSKREGIRECFVPREGKVFAQCDYPQLELYALAQCCVSWLGYSKLAEALNAGLDAHTWFASRLHKVPYEQGVELHAADDPDFYRMRQLAKAFDFGKPGGLGDNTFKTYAKKAYGLELSDEDVEKYGKEWKATWPEMTHYFRRISNLLDVPEGKKATVESLFTKRFRSGDPQRFYCAACNNGFQALGSDCAKSACRNIGKRLYSDVTSPLYGSRLVAFVHDEFIVETDDGPNAHEAAYALAAEMAAGANVFLPDVPIPVSKLKPVLMRRWSKKARQVFDAQGRLTPWE
jgi:DNA polymerase-1